MPNVAEKLTFGIELEGVTATPESSIIQLSRNFTKRFDHSIKADDGSPLPASIEAGGGFEFITPVQAVDVRMNNVGERLALLWGDSLNAVQDLCRCVARVNRSCGVHIHIGKPSREGLTVSKWEPEKVRTMLAIGMMLESKIFDCMPESRRNNHHCNTIRSRYSDQDLGQFYPVGNVVARKYDNIKRYCWMNLIETRRTGHESRPGRGASMALGTIEIRALGNTASADYILPWVTLWLKIAAYVAYLPSSLATLRCCMTNAFEEDFALLNKMKSIVVEVPTPIAEPLRVTGVRTGRLASDAASAQRARRDAWTVDPVQEAHDVQ